MRIITPDARATVEAALLAGAGIRAAASAAGVSKVTVNRYRRLLVASGVTLYCGCGKTAGHNGWCAWRYRQSPARQAFIATLRKPVIIRAREAPRELVTYPFVLGTAREEHDLVLAVNAVVPRYLPEHVRADVCQEMLVALLAGDLLREEIGRRAPEFLRAHNRQAFSKFKFVSLDAPLGHEGRLLHEILAA